MSVPVIIRQAARLGRRYRISQESTFPLRGADGRAWTERKRDTESQS